MAHRKLFLFMAAILLAGLAGSWPTASAQTPRQSGPLKIGMAKTFFNDIPKAFVDFATEPFKKLMKETTGLDGDLVPNYDPFEVARLLNEDKLQLGVFHGHEYAWA